MYASVVNMHSDPVSLVSARPDCACTTPFLPHQSIEPNDWAILESVLIPRTIGPDRSTILIGARSGSFEDFIVLPLISESTARCEVVPAPFVESKTLLVLDTPVTVSVEPPARDWVYSGRLATTTAPLDNTNVEYPAGRATTLRVQFPALQQSDVANFRANEVVCMFFQHRQSYRTAVLTLAVGSSSGATATMPTRIPAFLALDGVHSGSKIAIAISDVIALETLEKGTSPRLANVLVFRANGAIEAIKATVYFIDRQLVFPSSASMSQIIAIAVAVEFEPMTRTVLFASVN